jgi:SAM-dependent methyltransferase
VNSNTNNTKSCLACGAETLEEVLDLGLQAPANNLLSSLDEKDYWVYQLGIEACLTCGHGQLTKFVSPEEMFSDYLYVSSTSQTMRDHMAKLANFVLNLKGTNTSVLELGSNDGLFLKSLKDVGINDFCGVDPAENIASTANEEGLTTVVGFWPDVADQFEDNSYDVVIGQNVFAHTLDPHAALKEVKRVLKSDGFAIFQTSQADMIANGEFDTIYHEHCSFFCENSMDSLAKRVGMKLAYTHYVEMHGNSSLYVLVNEDIEPDTASIELAVVSAGLYLVEAKDERTAKIRKDRAVADWEQFYQIANGKKSDANEVVNEWRERNYRVISVGAAAKGITFLRAANLSIDCILDEAPLKVGKFVPGLGVQIVDFSNVAVDDAYIISAWNFAKEIALKLVQNGANPDAPCFLYFPETVVTTLGYLAVNGSVFK